MTSPVEPVIAPQVRTNASDASYGGPVVLFARRPPDRICRRPAGRLVDVGHLAGRLPRLQHSQGVAGSPLPAAYRTGCQGGSSEHRRGMLERDLALGDSRPERRWVFGGGGVPAARNSRIGLVARPVERRSCRIVRRRGGTVCVAVAEISSGVGWFESAGQDDLGSMRGVGTAGPGHWTWGRQHRPLATAAQRRTRRHPGGVAGRVSVPDGVGYLFPNAQTEHGVPVERTSQLIWLVAVSLLIALVITGLGKGDKQHKS